MPDAGEVATHNRQRVASFGSAIIAMGRASAPMGGGGGRRWRWTFELERCFKTSTAPSMQSSRIHRRPTCCARPTSVSRRRTKSMRRSRTTLNLFLHEVSENRDLRDPEPIYTLEHGTYKKLMPPLRIDCCYLVTAWSSKSGAQRAAEEHQLLGQALAWLSRFGTIPETYLRGVAGRPTLSAADPGRASRWPACRERVLERAGHRALGSPSGRSSPSRLIWSWKRSWGRRWSPASCVWASAGQGLESMFASAVPCGTPARKR